VFDADRAKWVSGFVRYATGGALQGRVGVGFSGATGGDRTEVVFGAVLLYADGTGRILCFAELGVLSITLTVTAVGVRVLREVFCNSAYAVLDSKSGYTQTC
jgi:hypothetical protein